MRRYIPLLLIPALSLLVVWGVSCQDHPRDSVPLRPADLAPVVLDLSFTPDLSPPPDLRQPPADGGDGGGGATDGPGPG